MQPNFEWPNFTKYLFPEYMGIPIPVPIKYRKFSTVNFSATKIHGEFYSHINVHTITIFITQYFTHDFLMTTLLVKLPNTSTRGLLSM